MKFGFEREFFVKAKNQFVLCPQVMPHAECGFLAESRGTPDTNPITAAFLLLAAEHQLFAQASRNRVKLVTTDVVNLAPELLRDALRRYGKEPTPHERGNMYGKDYAADDNKQRAGLHVHFSNEQTVEASAIGADGRRVINSRSVSGFIDMPKIILKLDTAFANEIAKAERVPGCYELKSYGFEYRSLPASIDVREVAAILETL
jgi:hypothetical protein